MKTAKVPFTNDTDKIVYPGGESVRPGETKMILPVYLKPFLREQNSQPNTASTSGFDLRAFVSQKQEDEIYQLPDLTDDQLNQVVEHYQSNKCPKKLAPRLDEELASRQLAKELETYTQSLREMGDEALASELEAMADRPEFLERIDSAIKLRFEASLKEMTDEQLQEQLLAQADDADALKLVQKELSDRESGDTE